jgi:hypothetical protein
MRTNKLAIAAVLAVAALSANAAGPRMESDVGPFTYEALGATPSLSFGRAKAAPAAAEAPKPATVKGTANRTDTPARAGAAPATFTYDTLGATPRVEVRKPARSEVVAQPAR